MPPERRLRQGDNSGPLTRLDLPDTRAADDAHFGHFSDFHDRCAAGTPYGFAFTRLGVRVGQARPLGP